ncbi:diphosphomevalonate decarboxylase [Aerococcus sanguinicola]|uniref:diphosphomevalonate decarboxylase n=1 Tax=unclassified Aerococcus TaxID=2618060 RepID=UPI0008A3DEAE|nr:MULTISPECIES: diphosphomevalonate decarboxylase [unclassified Aerococcus]MDK6232818.1 diphosphomevalonate decarboxylase [Aerococcus sp. UMB10185]MDK6854891.1 diphosphomevalonate decarboxylase [Aerococcus sp. UMB7533]OFN02596.1 diphosphomevalonate decarboxylase [Aerococcus sp. HMSC062A02]OHO45424.1 diphosphomevalonate decarboxylase [Aerococcus sp. HMSC035B07]
MTTYQGMARAHTNIALIKYWGKADSELFIPMNSSLSLTLDALYTDTKVCFSEELKQDSFCLNGEEQAEGAVAKISRFLDFFRDLAQLDLPCRVESVNHVPTGAGLASSASAFAALAAACRQALTLDLTDQELSTYARRGSGSATRSIFPGFVKWEKGDRHENSRAVPLDPADWGVAMVILALNTQHKKIPSRQGMAHTIETSAFYPAWPSLAEKHLKEIEAAIQRRDLKAIGQIAEANAMAMHATMLASDPPFTYFEPASLEAMDQVRSLRDQGYTAYFTMDAGPNIKVLCPASESQDIAQAMEEAFPEAQVITSQVGPGIQSLDHWPY